MTLTENVWLQICEHPFSKCQMRISSCVIIASLDLFASVLFTVRYLKYLPNSGMNWAFKVLICSSKRHTKIAFPTIFNQTSKSLLFQDKRGAFFFTSADFSDSVQSRWNFNGHWRSESRFTTYLKKIENWKNRNILKDVENDANPLI